jgi:hypothetical protein
MYCVHDKKSQKEINRDGRRCSDVANQLNDSQKNH